jgi:hypothetical protein
MTVNLGDRAEAVVFQHERIVTFVGIKCANRWRAPSNEASLEARIT